MKNRYLKELLVWDKRPVVKWGLLFSAKITCIMLMIAWLYMRLFPAESSDLGISLQTGFTIMALLLLSSTPLYVFWCRCLHKLQKATDLLCRVDGSRSYITTVATNILVGPQSSGLFLVAAAFLIAESSKLLPPSLAGTSPEVLGFLAFASTLILACMTAPIFIGGLLYLGIVSGLSRKLKKYHNEAPISDLKATLMVITGLLLPSLLMGANLNDGYTVVAFFALQLCGLKLAILTLDKYRLFLTRIIDELPEQNIESLLETQATNNEKRTSFKLWKVANIIGRGLASVSRVRALSLLAGTVLVGILTGYFQLYCGSIALMTGSNNFGKWCYSSSVRVNPNITEGYLQLSELYCKNQLPDEAMKVLSMALKKGKFTKADRELLIRERAKITGIWKGNKLKALEELDPQIKEAEGTSYHPNHLLAELYSLRFRINTLAQDDIAAASDLEKYRKYFKRSYPCELEAAERYEQTKQYEKVVETLANVGLNEQYWSQRAAIKAKQLKDYRGAAQDYSALIDDIPAPLLSTQYFRTRAAEYLKARAEAYSKLGDKAAADQDITRAQELDSTNSIKMQSQK